MEEIPQTWLVAQSRFMTERVTMASPTLPSWFLRADESQQDLYPRTADDVLAAASLLRRFRLPDELIRPILERASYSALRFSAHSVNREPCWTRGTYWDPQRAYVQTAAIAGLAPERSRCLSRFRVEVMSYWKGWESGPHDGSWSWIELGRRRRRDMDEGKIWDRIRWADNEMYSRDWQCHSIDYVEGKQSDADDAIVEWIRGIRNGDRISVIPMALHSGSADFVEYASVEVVVDVFSNEMSAAR